MKRIVAISLAMMMLVSALETAAFAVTRNESMPIRQSEAEDIPVVIDVLILRPLGLASCAVGLVAAVVALPFAIPSGSTDKVSKSLIRDPFYYTFKRPLGKNMPGNMP